MPEENEANSGKSVIPPKNRRRRRKILLLVFCGILVASVCGLFLWRHFSSYESTDDAQADAHLYPVSARIRGHVIRVNVGDNEYVRQGAVLVEIDPKDYQVAVDQARADLDNAEATAQSMRIDVPITATNTSSQLQSTAADIEKGGAGIVAAEKQLAAANAQVEQAQANDVKAQLDAARYKMLVEKEEVARQTYDTALAAARASAATVTGARANVEAAKQAVGGPLGNSGRRKRRSRLWSRPAAH